MDNRVSRILLLISLFISISHSLFLTTNTIEPEKDRFVTVQEYYNQIGCMKNCSEKCYNFSSFKWDQLTDACYDCIGACSVLRAKPMTISDANFLLHNVTACCPQYEKLHASVTVRFSVRDPHILKEAYVIWEYRMSRGIEDFAPSPWMVIMQTRARRATVEGLIRNLSFQFRATLIDGMNESERMETEWIDIEDVPVLEESPAPPSPPVTSRLSSIIKTSAHPIVKTTHPIVRHSVPTTINKGKIVKTEESTEKTVAKATTANAITHEDVSLSEITASPSTTHSLATIIKVTNDTTVHGTTYKETKKEEVQDVK